MVARVFSLNSGTRFPHHSQEHEMREIYCSPVCVSLTAQYAAVVPHWVVDVACVPK